MTHQSVLADFIPLRRKRDAGNYWHLEMAMLSLPTTTQNAFCTAVSDRQLVLKSTIPSFTSLQEQEVHWFPQEGIVVKPTLTPELAIVVFTGSVLQEQVLWVLKLMFDLCQTRHPLQNSEVSKAFFYP